jgi:uncharacterized membrane protein required for colicin V production
LRNSYGKPKPVAATINRLPAILLFLAVAIFIAADLLMDFDFNWVDYAIVIIIALFGLKGYLKGLINTIFSLIGYLAGLIAAYLFSPKLALIVMQKTTIGHSLGNKLDEVIPALSKIENMKISEAQSLLSLAEKIPELKKAATENQLLNQMLSVTSTAAETGSMYSETVVTVNDLIVFTILKILAFMVLFFVIKLVVVLIGKLLSRVLNSSAILGTANRTGGMAIGFVEGILICYLVFVFVIPALGSINIIKMPENYTQSLVLVWFNKLIALISGT